MIHPERRRENLKKLEKQNYAEYKCLCIFCIKPFLSWSPSADTCQECMKEQMKAALEISEAEGGW